MPPRPFSPLTRLLIVLALAWFPLSAPADPAAPVDSGDTPQAVSTDQDAPEYTQNTPEAPPAESDVEELPRMTNKTLAFAGVAFMLTVCAIFTAGAGYTIVQDRKKR